MPSTNKLTKWLTIALAFPLIILNGWVLLQVIDYFQPLFSIVVAAILLSFVLDYPIQFFQKQGVNRYLAIAGVFLLTVILVVGLTLTLVPLILEQIDELARILPAWIDSGTQQLKALQNWATNQPLPANLSNLPGQILDKLSNQLQNFTGTIVSFAVDTIGTFVNVLLTTVLTIYMLLNGKSLWDGLFQWLPPHLSLRVRQSLREDFHNYFIGQATVGAVLSVVLILIFLTLQVPLALLFGLAIGFCALFPFGTGIGITIVSLLIGLKNFWLGVEVLTVSVAIDQVNANFVAPRLLGSLTGLNPVWVVISLLIGIKLGGVLGLLLAIPVASFIKDIAESWRKGELSEEFLFTVNK